MLKKRGSSDATVSKKRAKVQQLAQVPVLPEEDSEEEDNRGPLKLTSEKAVAPTFDGQYVNKQRVLVFCSRGVTARARHLLEDLRKLVKKCLSN